MIAFAHHDRTTLRQYAPSPRGALAGGSPAIVRRRSRLNPRIFLAAVFAVLLFDVISIPAGQTIWNELLVRLHVVHPLESK